MDALIIVFFAVLFHMAYSLFVRLITGYKHHWYYRQDENLYLCYRYSYMLEAEVIESLWLWNRLLKDRRTAASTWWLGRITGLVVLASHYLVSEWILVQTGNMDLYWWTLAIYPVYQLGTVCRSWLADGEQELGIE